MKVRSLAVMILAVAAGSLGNVCLSKGMQAAGALSRYDPASLWAYFTGAVFTRWVMLGILLQFANYLMWLAVLSWADVSWALPLTALEYVLVAASAALFLGERVSLQRWAGIALIGAGVLLLVDSWQHPPAAEEPRGS